MNMRNKLPSSIKWGKYLTACTSTECLTNQNFVRIPHTIKMGLCALAVSSFLIYLPINLPIYLYVSIHIDIYLCVYVSR